MSSAGPGSSTRRLDVNGIELNLTVTGQGPALLLLHGFTGSSATWEPFRDAWPGFTQIAVDLPGHGASSCPVDPGRYGMVHCVADLLSALDQLGVEQAGVVGYSMGGRVALGLAVEAPHRLWGLVIEGASPGIEDAADRRARVQTDEALAASIETDGMGAFVTRWEALPLFASQRRLPLAVRERHRQQRLSGNPTGLANSLRGLGAGTQEPLWGHLGQVQVPALLIAGELDEKYSAIATRMAAAMPQARAQIVAGTGHAVHLEAPGPFAAIVGGFLGACLSRDRLKEVSR